MDKQYTVVLSEHVYRFFRNFVEVAAGSDGELEVEVEQRLLTDALIEICNAKENK